MIMVFMFAYKFVSNSPREQMKYLNRMESKMSESNWISLSEFANPHIRESAMNTFFDNHFNTI